MALGIEQIDDFVAGIHQKFAGEERLAAQDISLPLQEYKYASRLFSGNLKKDTMSTSQCKWKVKMATNDNFQVVGLYHRDSSTRVNVLAEGELKWGLTTNNYHYDIDEEIFRTGGRQIYDYIESLEAGFGHVVLHRHGRLDVRRWPVQPDAVAVPARVAAVVDHRHRRQPRPKTTRKKASTATSRSAGVRVGVGGLSCTTYAQWRNRTFPYVTVDRADFVEKVINSMDLCQFMPPVQRPDIVDQKRHDWELLTTHSRLALARQLLQAGQRQHRRRLGGHSGNGLHPWRSA